MKTTTIVIVAALAICAWAADGAVVAPREAASRKLQAPSAETDGITIPQRLSYQGKLTDTFGLPVADTLYAVRFRLYPQPTGGTHFWEENQQVRTRGGLFSTPLGSVAQIESVPSAGNLYLGMAVGGGAELTPRLRIASAAYAYLSERAANTDLLQGRDTTTFSRSTHNHDATYVNEAQADAITSGMIANGTIAAADLGQMGAASGQVMKWTGSAWAPRNDSVGGGGGGGTVTSVSQTTGVVCTPNPITATGTVGFDATWGDGRYVNEGLTAGGNLTGTYPNPSIATGAVDSTKLAAAAVTASKLNQSGAGAGQVMKWTGSAWQPRNDSVGAGDNAWVRGTPDSVLYTIRELGIARGGSSNMLYGGFRASHTNLGVGCTTGVSGQSYRACAVGGGGGNIASNDFATVGGGYSNVASGAYATVTGGELNRASGVLSAIGGGHDNRVDDTASCVAGGFGNWAYWPYSFIGGGYGNRAEMRYSTIGGGYGDTTYGNYSVIGGGYRNAANGDYASILGGNHNVTSGTGTGAISGRGNMAGGDGGDAVVAGGYGNTAYGSSAAVGGGTSNWAFADEACVPGGRADSATANYSFATNYHSIVGAPFTNSACFNSEYVTSSSQVRCANLSVSGAKAFTIDHPTDPTGKILNHYCVESPEMLVEYRGKATINSDGRVEVTLPHYFSALVREPMVQLTGVGTFEVYVAEKVDGNGFVIGGKPGTEVYWTVTGERDDQSARIGRILMPVEQPKTGVLAGRMLDDDYLVGSKAQLDRLGQGADYRFRTAAAQRLYEQMQQTPGKH